MSHKALFFHKLRKGEIVSALLVLMGASLLVVNVTTDGTMHDSPEESRDISNIGRSSDLISVSVVCLC